MERPVRNHAELDERVLGLPYPHPAGAHADELPATRPARDQTRNGKTYAQWQYKPTAGSGARVWFYVHEQTVYLVDVSTHHPNATK